MATDQARIQTPATLYDSSVILCKFCNLSEPQFSWAGGQTGGNADGMIEYSNTCRILRTGPDTQSVLNKCSLDDCIPCSELSLGDMCEE